MRKIWTIARREYGAMVATKAFLLSITLMPALMFGGIFVAGLLQDVGESEDRTIVIADGTGGVLFDELVAAVESRRAPSSGGNVSDRAELGGDAGGEIGGRVGGIVLRRHPSDALSDDDRFDLSEQVRRGDIEAFAEIPAEILARTDAKSSVRVGFYARNPMISPERRWMEDAINEVVIPRRIAELQLDPELVKEATQRVPVDPLGLFKQHAEGSAAASATAGRSLVGLFVPIGMMMLMFMVIFLAAQPMLESLLEEKGDRIAELLLGSANPFELMSGKLLGNVAGSLTVITIYAVGGYAALTFAGNSELIPFRIVPWFVLFQVLAVLLFSSIFMAIGAAVNQLKEAQTMLLPIWLVLVIPMFVWLQIVRDPNGPIATWLTFFPPATPMVIVLRLSTETVIPVWQIIAGLVLLLAATAACIYLAGRVFRVGLLWQGKTPSFRQLIRWALSG